MQAMEEGENKEEMGVRWGKAFTWKIRGAGIEKVWGITGDFVGVDKWISTLVQSSELIQGQPQKPGCVRRPILYPASPGQPFTFAIEKLLLMDELTHHYQYTILGGTLPGFSLMQGYVSTFKLSSLTTTTTSSSAAAATNMHTPTTIDDHSCHAIPGDDATLLHWSFTCNPVSTLSEEEAHNIAFSLYEAGINDLKQHLALPDNSITLLA